MGESGTLHILKHAILLEKRGKAFYENAAKQTASAEVRDFFNLMAFEEDKHLSILHEQFKAFQDKGSFAAGQFSAEETSRVATEVMNFNIKEHISAAGYEAAAIEAAIAMESRSVKIYLDRSVTAADPEEKALYKWLADWEQKHLNMLEEIDRELLEKVWYDNHFWPF